MIEPISDHPPINDQRRSIIAFLIILINRFFLLHKKIKKYNSSFSKQNTFFVKKILLLRKKNYFFMEFDEKIVKISQKRSAVVTVVPVKSGFNKKLNFKIVIFLLKKLIYNLY